MARRGPLPAAALVTVVLSLGVFLLAGGASSRAPAQRKLTLTPTGQPSAPATKLSPAPLAFEPLASGKGYLVRDGDYGLSVDARGTRLTTAGASIRTQLVRARTTQP